MHRLSLLLRVTAMLGCICCCAPAHSQVAVHGETIHSMAGAPIQDGIVIIREGRIAAIGRAADIQVPEGFRVLKGKVVTPGLIDAHSVVGLSGILNIDADQDQLDNTTPLQPELRAVDAYNAREELIEWVRSFGVTTLHTGHAPGQLISGQTMIVKTSGNTVEDALLQETAAIAVTLTTHGRKSGTKSPGTRGKMIAMLREAFIEAQEYQKKVDAAANDDEKDPPARNLRHEQLGNVLQKKTPLMVTADKAQDISSALRLAEEFDIRLWLDSAVDSYLLVDQIKAAEVPVLLHPPMLRTTGERSNASFETAAKLTEAGIPVALQSGYEPYVPKTRVVLFEAGMAAANGLTFNQALAMITKDAASILGVAEQVGSIEVGKHGDIAIYDGDPFEYATHCTAVVIEGQVVSDTVQ